MTIHYHGTPITPRPKLLDLGGKHFCISYAAPGDVQCCHEIGQSVMLDNGAFSIWRMVEEKKSIPARLIAASQGDWSGYYEWVKPWLRYWTTWAIIPDVITGSEDENDALVAEWPFGEAGAPVWHMHESIERLIFLCERWPRVCVGSSGEYATVGDKRWHIRMHDAMNQLCGVGRPPRAWLHMLRGLALAGSVYPFASVDSTNIARNHAGTKTRPRQLPHLMAAQIDCLNCPAIWEP